MTIIGILIISMSFLIFILTLIFAKLRDHIKLILPITIAFGFLGYGLIIYERVVELTLPGGVSVKTAAQQTVEDAKFIRETRDTVFAQSKTIGLVVQQADELSRKITDFDLIMNKSQEELNKTRETLSAQSNAIGSVVLRANELSDKITGFESFIQSSQKEINSILETLNPYTKPIMTANCRMVLEAQSSYQEKFKNKIPRLISGGNGGLWFVRGNDTILALTSVSGRETPTSEDSALYQTELSLSTVSAFTKIPVNSLKQAQTVTMWHDKILEQREIFGGEVLCVINSVIMFDFSIPRQTIQKQGRFFVQEVSHVFDSFK